MPGLSGVPRAAHGGHICLVFSSEDVFVTGFTNANLGTPLQLRDPAAT